MAIVVCTDMKSVYNKVLLNSTKYRVAYMYKSAACAIRHAWRMRNSRGANNRSIIHIHPRDMRRDVRLNIGLDLWSQLTL